MSRLYRIEIQEVITRTNVMLWPGDTQADAVVSALDRVREDAAERGDDLSDGNATVTFPVVSVDLIPETADGAAIADYLVNRQSLISANVKAAADAMPKVGDAPKGWDSVES